MSVATAVRPEVTEVTTAPASSAPSAPYREGHTHDKTCWWDLHECRWAGPAHADPRLPRPRRG